MIVLKFSIHDAHSQKLNSFYCLKFHMSPMFVLGPSPSCWLFNAGHAQAHWKLYILLHQGADEHAPGEDPALREMAVFSKLSSPSSSWQIVQNAWLMIPAPRS